MNNQVEYMLNKRKEKPFKTAKPLATTSLLLRAYFILYYIYSFTVLSGSVRFSFVPFDSFRRLGLLRNYCQAQPKLQLQLG